MNRRKMIKNMAGAAVVTAASPVGGTLYGPVQ